MIRTIAIQLPSKWHYDAMTRFLEDMAPHIDSIDLERMMIDIGNIPGGYAQAFLLDASYARLLIRHAERIARELRGPARDASWRQIGVEIVEELIVQMQQKSQTSR